MVTASPNGVAQEKRDVPKAQTGGQHLLKLRLILCCACVCSVVLACSSSLEPVSPTETSAIVDNTPDPSPTTSLATPPTTVEPAAERSTLSELLSWVPWPDNREKLFVGSDLNLAAAAFGYDRPDCDTASADERFADLDTLTRWARSGEPPAISARLTRFWRGLRDPSDLGSFRESFGFGPCEISAFVDSTADPDNVHVFSTSVSASNVAEAVESDPVWAPEISLVEHPVSSYWSWETQANLARSSPARFQGEGGAIAILDDGLVIRSGSDELMERALDRGPDTLGGRADVMAVADRIGTDRCYTLGLWVGSVTPSTTPVGVDQEEFVAQNAHLVDYLFLGWGLRFDGEQHLITLVLAHDSAADAATNVTAFQQTVREGRSLGGQPWADQIRIVEAAVEGELAVFTLAGTEERRLPPTLVDSALERRDTLFWTTFS